MSTDNEFNELMGRLQRGDPGAQAAVFHRFAALLTKVARNELRALPSSKADPDGVVDSMLASFMRRFEGGQFNKLVDWDSLQGLLIRRTMWRCGHEKERGRTQKRDFWREQSPPQVSPESSAVWDPLSSDPTPSQVAEHLDTIEWLHLEIGPDDYRVYQLESAGYNAREIAAETGLSESSVRRILREIREILSRFSDD